MLQGIQKVVVYLDDILVTGSTDEEHLQNLVEVLKHIQKAGLRLKKEKCEFLAKSVVYLGHKIDAKVLHATTDKVDAITKTPTPQSCSEVKAYLGLLNYYNKFMPNLASELASLYQLLCKGTPWQWEEKENEAFKQLKQLLLSSQLLVHFDPSKELTYCHCGLFKGRQHRLCIPVKQVASFPRLA